jgi:hypothetical protein
MHHQEIVVEGAEGHACRAREADHLAMVMGHVRRVLFIIAVADFGVRFLDDARQRPFYAGLPRTLPGDQLAVLIFRRVFAEVPDIPGLILRIIVSGLLDELTRLRIRDDIAHGGAGYAVNHLRLVGDRDRVDLLEHVSFRVGVVQEGRTRSPG